MSESGCNPAVIVLAGINGAGKTTSSRALLAKTLRVKTFVNADVIAQGIHEEIQEFQRNLPDQYGTGIVHLGDIAHAVSFLQC